MQPHRIALLISLVFVILACSIAPAPGIAGKPTSSAPTSLSDGTAAAPMPSSSAETLAPISLHVGRGAQGSWFELYFTDPANPAASQFTGGVDERLVRAIDGARLSIHLAMFNLSLNDVRLALIRAHRRGVDVRLVTESDNLDGDDLQRLVQAGIPVLGDRRESTMHDKFMVIDGGQVWTGSMNFTGSGVYTDNNCLIRITSDSLARAYEAEFSEMFVEDHFGEQVGTVAPLPAMDVGGTLVEVRFSPDNRPESELVNLLDTARSSIQFLAFSFTSNALAEALIRAQHAGLRVQGVMDAEQAASNIGSELGAFRSNRLDVRLDGNPGQMHEKVLIIDGEIVVFGSYNFSRSANESNDENLLIVHSPLIASQFSDEFARIYSVATP